MRISVFVLPLLASGVLSACQHSAAIASKEAPSPAVVAAPADDNLNAVLWMQRSAEYQAASVQTYRAAAQVLDRALKQAQWDALVPEEREGPVARLKPAVIMDVDETVLDNSPYQARLVRSGEEYNETTWDAWVQERRARAVPGVVEFARAANARGVTVFYLSNRAEHLAQATLDNLRAVGMPAADERVFLGLGTFVEGCEQHGSEKLCRRRKVGQEYRVLMQFGDQLGDFVQIIANTPQDRAGLLQRYGSWFGERWWMLPNPSYGSWEPAVFNNEWSSPREVRRAAKREALEITEQNAQ